MSVNSSMNLISQIYNVDNQIQCLSECNKIDYCATATFNTNKNCLLYSNYFNDKMVASTDSTLFQKDCSNIETVNYTSCMNKDQSLLNIFNNYKLLHTIITPGNTHGFGMFIDNNTFYYLCDVNKNKIIIYDEKWENKSIHTYSGPSYMKQVDNYLYISTGYGIIKTDKNLSVLASFNLTGSKRGIHYDDKTNTILAAVSTSHYIIVLDLNLNYLGNISIAPYNPYNLEYHNDNLYVGSTSKAVLIIKNNTIIRSFNTSCNAVVSSVLLDNFGYIAVSCEGPNMIYLYHTNGTYMNKNMSTSNLPMDIKIDTRGRFIIASKFLIYIYN